MPETEQAQRGARSGEGPSPGREGGMEPQGFGSNTSQAESDELDAMFSASMAYRPELEDD